MDEVAPRRVHSSVAGGLSGPESKPGSVRYLAHARLALRAALARLSSLDLSAENKTAIFHI